MLYLVIERYREGCAAAIYERAATRGRLMPDGLEYVDSWVTLEVDRCYQLVRCEDETLIRRWIAQWDDLVTFEYFPVLTSREAAERARGSG